MNTGVLVYRIIELLVFAYVSFLFFKMGQNKDPRYATIREKLTKIIPIFNRDMVHYVSAVLMIIVIVIRVAENFPW